jgi:hypothetical protein
MRTAATGARRALQESMPSNAAHHTCCSCALLAGAAGRARTLCGQYPRPTAHATRCGNSSSGLQRGLRAGGPAPGISSARAARAINLQ